MQVKVCKKCKVEKPAEAFYLIPVTYKGKTSHYLDSRCKQCKYIRARELLALKAPKKAPQLYDAQKDFKPMRSPINWPTMKHHTLIEKHSIYPTCSKGHKYVGTRCLLCKYSLQTTSRLV